MSQKKPEKKNKKIYQKWWVWALAIVIIIVGIYLVFHNEIKAYRLGIDAEYLENSTYCLNHSDCTSTVDCEPINIYNHNSEDGVCEDVEKGNAGAICYPDGCRIDRGGMGYNDIITEVENE